MNLIDKYLRGIFCLFIIISIFAVSVSAQTQLIVETDNAQVNELTDYSFNFQTSIGDYAHINKGELIITLPSGFSITTLDSVELIDDYKHHNYTIKKIENDLQSIHLYLNRDKSHDDHDDDDDELDDDYPKDTTISINVTVRLSKIQNPSESGNYQISLLGLRKNKKIAIGPLLSEPFTITTASIYSIEVIPSESINLQAGDVQQFSASAFDQYGNKIEGTVFQWSLFECSNCVGQFTDSTLKVTRVGAGIAQATAGEVYGLSGQITVTPGDLSRMTLQIDETQFVGNIINHNAAIILYDAYNNLKTDYDLSANPIELFVSDGELNRYFLDNNLYQVGGVVRLKDFELIYSGLSGQVSIYADNGFVSSNIELVYFNNYDIIDVQNVNGETISTVFAGDSTSVTILIRNEGNQQASSILLVQFDWVSYADSNNLIVVHHVDPPAVGEIAELAVKLPPLANVGSFDELYVTVQASYSDGSLSGFPSTSSNRRFTVEVLEASQLSLIADSFKPDTIIHQIPFEISFEIETDGFAQTIDSTLLSVAIRDKMTQQKIADLYIGSPIPEAFINGIITYNNLPAVLNTENSFENGWYEVVMDYQLFSSGNMLTLSEPLVDSIFIFFNNQISLVEGSLTPKIVYAGTNVSFEFKINIESDAPYVFHGNESLFRVFDNSYSSSTNLFLESDSLYPGENILRSAAISIQSEQVGTDLYAEAEFKFCLPGMFDTLTFETDFTSASVPIKVLELPLVQILDLEVIAPNAPIVNSSQEIQFKATLANLSSNTLDSVALQLKSIDGNSDIIKPLMIIHNIGPFDTATVLFDVVAASMMNSLPESFRVDIADNTISTLNPVNNSAFLKIEEAASLEFSYRLNGIENIEGAVVGQGDHLHLEIEYENNGTARVTDGVYQLIIEGLSGNSPDTFTGCICADSAIDFDFKAPLIDTSIQFSFSVIEVPLDVNYNRPVVTINESINFTVISVSTSAELVIEPSFIGSNLILPERPKDLFLLSITNNSVSSLNSIQLEIIDMNSFTIAHNAIDAQDVISIGKSYFSENDEKVTITTAGGNELMFWFTDFIIAPRETRTIQLTTEFIGTSQKELLLEILESGIKAVYSDGPNQGKAVKVKSISGNDKILSYQVVLKGNSLCESFIIENNPFNPTIQPVQFAFELSEDAPIEFQMFTLTGEEVFRMYYPPGGVGSSIGENIIEWDGYNNSGEMVLNGVYIASIINKTTGEYARIKVAVVK